MVEVMDMEPVPVAAPMILAEVVPTFTLPASIEIPVKIPGAVARPLVVDKLIPLTVFPCTFDAGLVPTVSSMALYKLAYAPL